MLEFITAKEIAAKLEGTLPAGFSKFETLTCHSAEARRLTLFDSGTLDDTTKTGGKGEDKQEAYAQTLANELSEHGFVAPEVKGYIGSVIADENGRTRRTIVELSDGSEHRHMHGYDVKKVFTPKP
ncbi:hypothetical protein EO087_09575 [Dyella sp. M7H15-1]|uniref:hypothetical protein n=1 Tax=Dyella sp. M7H15-1 TaxID=2501295 RepID=UPI0010050D44|nr:hypothetical protein [Dyella sp. M7H15-1]QAU24206.1 hypothetical protein EO087_09575 [Dyella sp. M7H15-1]